MDLQIEPFPRTESIWQALAVIPRQPARAGQVEYPGGRVFPAVTFDDFDLWIALEGRSTVEVLGRTCPLDAGTCFLLPARVSATQQIAPDTVYRLAFIHFDLAYQGKILRDARPYVKEAPTGSEASPTLELPGLPALALFASLDTVRLAERVSRAVRRWDHVAQLESLSLVVSALAEHLREATRPSSGGSAGAEHELGEGSRGRGVSTVDAALQYLEDNLHRPVFLDEVAGHVGISPTYLGRLFREQLNQTPMQALNRMRLTRAQSLLRDPALNVSEVARGSGFASLSFFTRVFARAFGCPPTVFRHGLQRSVKATEVTQRKS